MGGWALVLRSLWGQPAGSKARGCSSRSSSGCSKGTAGMMGRGDEGGRREEWRMRDIRARCWRPLAIEVDRLILSLRHENVKHHALEQRSDGKPQWGVDTGGPPCVTVLCDPPRFMASLIFLGLDVDRGLTSMLSQRVE